MLHDGNKKSETVTTMESSNQKKNWEQTISTGVLVSNVFSRH